MYGANLATTRLSLTLITILRAPMISQGLLTTLIMILSLQRLRLGLTRLEKAGVGVLLKTYQKGTRGNSL